MKRNLIIAGILGIVSVFAVLARPVYAGGKCPNGGSYEHSIAECSIPNNPDGTPKDLDTGITNILNAVIGIVGLVAVATMIIGGILFLTSQGDTAKVTRARHTILYGVVGLVVALLAFAIVNFVIGVIARGSAKK